MGKRTIVTVILLGLAAAGAIAQPVVLFDNGPLITSPGTGLGGADESVVEDLTLGDQLFGFDDGSTVFPFRAADDFTVSDLLGWRIETVTFFAFQAGSGTTSTITGVNLQIWNGPPGAPGSSVIFGDTVTDRLADSTWSGIYRVAESAPGNGARPIMANRVTVGAVLGPGTYWLDWQSAGTLGPDNGPFAPPVTIAGQAITGDGLWFNGFTWGPAVDAESGNAKGFAFIVEGEPRVAPVVIPTLGTWGLVLLAMLLAGAAVRRLLSHPADPRCG